MSAAKTLNGPFLALTLCVAAVIVHGSLFPYSFHENGGIVAGVSALLDSWSTPPSGLADLVANLSLYVPLGFFGVLSIRSRCALPVVAGFGLVLSTTVEIAQFFDAGRITNMSDVYLNTAGTVLGGVLGILLDSRVSRGVHRGTLVEPAPAILLVALVAYRLYPYVPTIDVHKYWHSVKPLVAHPDFAAWPGFRYFVLWLTVSYLLATALRRASSVIAVLQFAAFVFAAEVVIVGLTLSASELAGAAVAFFLWFVVLGRSNAAATIVFVLLAVAVTIWRLQPFDFHDQATQFGWIPFRSILQGSLGANYVACVEKIFLYGSLIWIGSRVGPGPWISTFGVAVLLLVTSLAETHLPGRSAELTDCVMAILIGCGLAALNARSVGHAPEQGTAERFQVPGH